MSVRWDDQFLGSKSIMQNAVATAPLHELHGFFVVGSSIKYLSTFKRKAFLITVDKRMEAERKKAWEAVIAGLSSNQSRLISEIDEALIQSPDSSSYILRRIWYRNHGFQVLLINNSSTPASIIVQVANSLRNCVRNNEWVKAVNLLQTDSRYILYKVKKLKLDMSLPIDWLRELVAD